MLPKIDEIDIRLLNALQTDSRRAIGEIAAEIGLSASPCYRRQRLLEEAGIIRQYVTLLDEDALGLSVSVFISIELESQDDQSIRAFEEAIVRLPEVMECYTMTGDTDYLVRVVIPDVKGYASFLKGRLDHLPGVRKIRSSFTLRRVIHKTALPLGQLISNPPRGTSPLSPGRPTPVARRRARPW